MELDLGLLEQYNLIASILLLDLSSAHQLIDGSVDGFDLLTTGAKSLQVRVESRLLWSATTAALTAKATRSLIEGTCTSVIFDSASCPSRSSLSHAGAFGLISLRETTGTSATGTRCAL